MTLLKVEKIERTYCTGSVETHALRPSSLSVNAGEFVVIMGASGSGKSTLLHLLGLLDAPTSGSYFFEEESVEGFDEVRLAKLRNSQMGFVFQAFNLLPRTSVLENVKLPFLYSEVLDDAERTKRAQIAIKSVELDHRMKNEPSQLSGGEKQRVAIARALVNDPKIIFADEPTGNLDSKTGAAVMKLFERLCREEGKTIVLITHDKNTAEYGDRLITLRDGEIIYDGKINLKDS